MKLRKKDLERLRVDVTERGFVLWVKEKTMVGDTPKMVNHWLLDGSTLFEGGDISVSVANLWKIRPEYDQDNGVIRIKRKKQ